MTIPLILIFAVIVTYVRARDRAYTRKLHAQGWRKVCGKWEKHSNGDKA